MKEADGAIPTAPAGMAIAVPQEEEEHGRSGLRFRFHIARDGRILGFEASSALERLGWGRGLVGRRCYTALACRDLEGRSLCDACVELRAAPPDAVQRTRVVSRLAASDGDIVVSHSSVRRLPQRRLAIEGEV